MHLSFSPAAGLSEQVAAAEHNSLETQAPEPFTDSQLRPVAQTAQAEPRSTQTLPLPRVQPDGQEDDKFISHFPLALQIASVCRLLLFKV
jgi:hypothetical protein